MRFPSNSKDVVPHHRSALDWVTAFVLILLLGTFVYLSIYMINNTKIEPINEDNLRVESLDKPIVELDETLDTQHNTYFKSLLKGRFAVGKEGVVVEVENGVYRYKTKNTQYTIECNQKEVGSFIKIGGENDLIVAILFPSGVHVCMKRKDKYVEYDWIGDSNILDFSVTDKYITIVSLSQIYVYNINTKKIISLGVTIKNKTTAFGSVIVFTDTHIYISDPLLVHKSIGSVYVYKRNRDETYTLESTIYNDNINESFGHFIQISEEYILIGLQKGLINVYKRETYQKVGELQLKHDDLLTSSLVGCQYKDFNILIEYNTKTNAIIHLHELCFVANKIKHRPIKLEGMIERCVEPPRIRVNHENPDQVIIYQHFNGGARGDIIEIPSSR